MTHTAFSSLGLSPALLQGLEELGFHHCTPIQAATLPLALTGIDVVGQAQTGTGKTVAFLLATMDRLLKNPPGHPAQPRALILAPTRELAIQIHKDAEALGKHTGLILGLAYGGTGYEKQRTEITAGVDILIGTPGRIIDYFKQHVFGLGGAQVMVLDEADRMFDLGFIADIRYLLRRLPAPEKRLSMLFSATMPLRVTELAYEHMNNPQHVAINPEQITAKEVEELIYFPSNAEKIPLLLGLLGRLQPERAMIFVNTKRVAERVGRYLTGNGYSAEVLSGDVPQNKRQRLMVDFHEGRVAILVATDVAARGLHIPGVTHVFNFDLPQDAEDYVHRIGRTARAGAKGEAISLGCEDYSVHLPDIEEYIGHRIPTARVTPDLLVTPAPAAPRPPGEERPHGRRHGQAKSGHKPGGGHKPREGAPRRRRAPGGGPRQGGKTSGPPRE